MKRYGKPDQVLTDRGTQFYPARGGRSSPLILEIAATLFSGYYTAVYPPRPSCYIETSSSGFPILTL